jgi:nucleoside-diphosphate-sugar epimerase
VRRVVYASSLTIQLADLNRPDFRESSYPAPKNLYACTKLFGESLASIYQHQYGMEMISLRIGQPFPVGTKTDDVWRHSLRARSLFVTMEDVGRAVEAGVFADVPGGIFNVVSESDNPRVDLTAARGLGYVPLNRFSAEGLFAREAEGGDWNLISPTVATTEL